MLAVCFGQVKQTPLLQPMMFWLADYIIVLVVGGVTSVTHLFAKPLRNFSDCNYFPKITIEFNGNLNRFAGICTLNGWVLIIDDATPQIVKDIMAKYMNNHYIQSENAIAFD